jgi:hypothetical protein
MMDLGPVYDQPPSDGVLYDFASEQLSRMEHFHKQPGAGMLYFVAYNPYRDHWRGGQEGDALRLVQSAIARGAWGVKVYPPSGYRAACNQVKTQPNPLGTHYPKLQWQARYGGLKKPADQALNQKLEALLEWCRRHDVPVFAHCGTGEFEARKGYGLYHSDPKFWSHYLATHPEPDGSPCRLRLWLGGGEHADWGKLVYDLCVTYPNVYCEITTHGDLTNKNRQAFFVERIAQCFEKSAQAEEKSPKRYPFSGKLMYGTDWFLPDTAERKQVLNAVQTAFLHERLRPHYADYFYGNALRYLKVADRLADERSKVPADLRSRLQNLLQTAPKR